MTTDTRFSAHYYELILRVRLQGLKWTVIILGPQGLMISTEKTYESEAEAKQAAVELAQARLHQEGHESRPRLEIVEWHSYPRRGRGMGGAHPGRFR
jgi:hypothetical protein